MEAFSVKDLHGGRGSDTNLESQTPPSASCQHVARWQVRGAQGAEGPKSATCITSIWFWDYGEVMSIYSYFKKFKLFFSQKT